MSDREQQPTFVPPMLLTSGAVPDGEAWTLEVKWDGCRAQLRYDGRSVALRTRHGRECSEDFPELASIAGVLGKRRVTLDGELVCLRCDGRPDVARLRDRRRLSPGQVELRPPTAKPASGCGLIARSSSTSDSANPRAHRRDAPATTGAHLHVRSLAPNP